jgi:adhesin/invasin
LDSLGVFNAASNLTAYTTIPPPCFKQCGPYAANDSITGNEILHITGGCMGPLEPAKSSPDGGRLPTTLQGTQVLFDGEAAALISVQATEILAITPQDVASKTHVTLTVQNQGAVANVVLNAAPAVPGIFVSSGKQAAAINEDGSLNAPDHPAPVGSIVSLYLTGAGRTNPQIDDGMLPDLPLPQLALPVTVQVGGAGAEVLYAGSAPGLAGVAQVNIRVPAVPASDAVPVQVAIGGNSRNQPVTIAVH